MIIKLTQAHIIGAFISYLIGVFIVPFVIEFSQKEDLLTFLTKEKFTNCQYQDSAVLLSGQVQC